MKFFIVILSLCVLQGCVGTRLLEPDIDVEKSYPELYTVPDRPAPKDFKKLGAELKEMQAAGQEGKGVRSVEKQN